MERRSTKDDSGAAPAPAPVNGLEARTALLEASVTELREEGRRMANLLRGNGAPGIAAQLALLAERIEMLQRQCRYCVWILVMLLAALVPALLQR